MENVKCDDCKYHNPCCGGQCEYEVKRTVTMFDGTEGYGIVLLDKNKANRFGTCPFFKLPFWKRIILMITKKGS